MKKNNVFGLVFVLALLLAGIYQPVSAQGFTMTSGGSTGTYSSGAFTTTTTGSTASYPVMPTNCVVLTSNLYMGLSDRYIPGGNITKLQNFLISRGYMNYYGATGYYGGLTYASVMRFQRDNNISPIGNVGPVTRARIQALTCNVVPPVVPPIQPPVVQQVPVVTSISPTAGPVGSTVTVYGYGFDSNSTVTFGGGGSIATNVQVINSNTLTFRVPERLLPPCAYGPVVCLIYGPAVEVGDYQVAVRNNYGTSNSLAFRVTSTTIGNSTGAPIINGIDSPSTLMVNQTGTWTVRATDVTSAGLNYRVVWGDEYQYPSSYAASQPSNFVQSATFTHAYTQTGTYTPRFYVRGSNNLVSEVSTTVQVTNQNQTQVPQIAYISPSSGTYRTVVTVTGSGFSRYNNSINYAGRTNAITGIESVDGRTLQFTVPATPCSSGMYCAQVVMSPGTYPVSVTNQYGTSNSVNFVLTSTAGGGYVNQSVSMGIGQSSTVNNSLTIRAIRIAEESRCPSGVYCIQAGRVVVETTIQSGDMIQAANLSYGNGTDAQSSVVVDGYTIRITNVTPQARQGGISSGEYWITYQVTR